MTVNNNNYFSDNRLMLERLSPIEVNGAVLNATLNVFSMGLFVLNNIPCLVPSYD